MGSRTDSRRTPGKLTTLQPQERPLADLLSRSDLRSGLQDNPTYRTRRQEPNSFQLHLLLSLEHSSLEKINQPRYLSFTSLQSKNKKLKHINPRTRSLPRILIKSRHLPKHPNIGNYFLSGTATVLLALCRSDQIVPLMLYLLEIIKDTALLQNLNYNRKKRIWASATQRAGYIYFSHKKTERASKVII